MLVINLSRNKIIADTCYMADHFFSRLKGLLGKKNLNKGEGLLIVPCSSIHTFFMRFPIDVIFINQANKVIKIVPSLKPYRFATSSNPGSGLVLELPEKIVFETGTKVGDQIEFKS